MQIYSLQHVPFEGPAMIANWAREKGHTLKELRSTRASLFLHFLRQRDF